MACSRMKSTSPLILPESANCVVPYFSPRFALVISCIELLLSRDYVKHVSGFDEIIDVRSPAEYEEDHIPGASEFSFGVINKLAKNSHQKVTQNSFQSTCQCLTTIREQK